MFARLVCFERFCKLVGAGGVFETAFDAFKFIYCVVDFHAAHKALNALKVAVAAVCECD